MKKLDLDEVIRKIKKDGGVINKVTAIFDDLSQVEPKRIVKIETKTDMVYIKDRDGFVECYRITDGTLIYAVYVSK